MKFVDLGGVRRRRQRNFHQVSPRFAPIFANDLFLDSAIIIVHSIRMNVFPIKLCCLLDDLGLSQAEAARRCGFAPRTFGNYCNGKREPDLDGLATICRSLGVTPNDLLLIDHSALPNRRRQLQIRADAMMHLLHIYDLEDIVEFMEDMLHSFHSVFKKQKGRSLVDVIFD